MRTIELGAQRLWDEPVPGQRDAANKLRIQGHRSFPFGKINGAGEWRQHNELGEADAGALGNSHGHIEGLGTVTGQAKDEGSQDVHAMPTKDLQAFDEAVAGAIEVLIDVLESLGSDGLDAYKRSPDVS